MKQIAYIENTFGLQDSNEIKAKCKIDVYITSVFIKTDTKFDAIILYKLVLSKDKKYLILTYEIKCPKITRGHNKHPFKFLAADIAPARTHGPYLQIQLYINTSIEICYPKVEAVI